MEQGRGTNPDKQPQNKNTQRYVDSGVWGVSHLVHSIRVTLSRPSTSLLSWTDRSKSQAEPSGGCTWNGKKGLYLERDTQETSKVLFNSRFAPWHQCELPDCASITLLSIHEIKTLPFKGNSHLEYK